MGFVYLRIHAHYLGVSQACAFFYDTDASNAELLQRIFLVSECALAIPSSSASSILRRQFVAIGPIVHIVLGRAARGVIVSLPAGYLVDGYGLQVRPASTRAIRLDVPYRMVPFAASCVVWLHPTIAWSVGAVVAPTHRHHSHHPPPCTHPALCAMPSRRTCHHSCRVAPLTLAKQPEHAVGTREYRSSALSTASSAQRATRPIVYIGNEQVRGAVPGQLPLCDHRAGL